MSRQYQVLDNVGQNKWHVYNSCDSVATLVNSINTNITRITSTSHYFVLQNQTTADRIFKL